MEIIKAIKEFGLNVLGFFVVIGMIYISGQGIWAMGTIVYGISCSIYDGSFFRGGSYLSDADRADCGY